MEKICIRPVQNKDYEQICQIINKSFGLHRYVQNADVLDVLLRQYLQSCLAEQSFTRVAEREGAVIGVIMGNAKNDYRMFAHVKPLALSAFYSLKLKLVSAGRKNEIEDYKNIHKIYADFLDKYRDKFDGVLTLFAVTEECRGLGIGKKLLSELWGYYKAQRVSRIYLFTDSTCNVGFYDSQGFSCLEKELLEVTSERKRQVMEVYLYAANL